MADFSKTDLEAISILNEISTLLQNAEVDETKRLTAYPIEFKTRNYKIRANLQDYPEHVTIEIIRKEAGA